MGKRAPAGGRKPRVKVLKATFSWKDGGVRYEVYALGSGTEMPNSGSRAVKGPAVVVRTLSRSGEADTVYKVDSPKLWDWFARLIVAGATYLTEKDIYVHSKEMDAVLKEAEAVVSEE